MSDITTVISSPGTIIGKISTPAEITVVLGTGIPGRPGDPITVNGVSQVEGNVQLTIDDILAETDEHILTDVEYADVLTIPNKMNSNGDNSNIDILTFDTDPSTDSLVEGQVRWNNTDGTLDIQHKNATQQVGQEIFIKVINKSGEMIPNASAVYFNGRQGNRPKIELAQSNTEVTSVVMGLTTQDIEDNTEGFITTFGYVRQIKTDYVDWFGGARLYVSYDTPGALTVVEPEAPHHADIIGCVAIVGGHGIGSIFVNIDRHKDLSDMADTDGTPLTQDGQFPSYHSAEGYFDFDKSITTILGTDNTTIPTSKAVNDALSEKQDNLTSGINIKTINGNSILGAGDLIADKTYRHVQILASSTWTINHFLNKMPSVTAVNSFGQQVVGEIRYESLDRVIIDYSGAFSGEAYLN